MRMAKNNSHETLQELLIGIGAFGILEQAVLMWLTDRKIYFTIGLWLGVMLSMAAAFHMHRSLDRALDLGQAASKYALSQNMVRYGVIIAVFVAVCVLDFANPLAAFAGIMCLKAGAYLQPFTHKIISKVKRR